MITLLFFALLNLYLFSSLYFLNRFRLPEGRKVTSLALACVTPGWAVAVARELHWLPRWGATLLIPFALCAGVVLVLSIFVVEMQNPKGPFQ